MLFLSAEALVAESLPGSPPLNNSLGVLVACHNFGTASVTQSFNHEFTWHNDATTPLVVEGVSTSCDCLQVTAFPRVIPAGGTDKLTVAAHPKTPGPTDWVVFARVTGSAEARLFWLSGTIGDAARTAFPPDLLVAATNLLANPARLAEISSHRKRSFMASRDHQSFTWRVVRRVTRSSSGSNLPSRTAAP